MPLLHGSQRAAARRWSAKKFAQIDPKGLEREGASPASEPGPNQALVHKVARLVADASAAERRSDEADRHGLVILIDALYEARTKLIVLAEAEPTALYPEGDGAFEFERTASRLQEMRSASWLEDR